MFARLFAVLTTLTVVVYSIPAEINTKPHTHTHTLGVRAEGDTYTAAYIEVKIPGHSRFQDAALDTGATNTDEFWGPQIKKYGFDKDPSVPVTGYKSFYWTTYDPSVDAKKLQDKDRQYNMSCKAHYMYPETEPSGATHTVEFDQAPIYQDAK
ncbi:uncharacterized protein I303_105886 [Kwoniella dejecticola CBS 10117]|uniref:Secreted protein n=1 Tax=Kwoniella dejecticola CBS 10117 TaxID=1296121 RepID=A0A1A6A0P9_9TREE|nr:uncharacterized protein I303_05908 [Kwoniella dejecticola CBS 10117]OBR83628.1 hypothetical protein I303_05908 [Kwoniella dejecticola CBS 10117]